MTLNHSSQVIGTGKQLFKESFLKTRGTCGENPCSTLKAFAISECIHIFKTQFSGHEVKLFCGYLCSCCEASSIKGNTQQTRVGEAVRVERSYCYILEKRNTEPK